MKKNSIFIFLILLCLVAKSFCDDFFKEHKIDDKTISDIIIPLLKDDGKDRWGDLTSVKEIKRVVKDQHDYKDLLATAIRDAIDEKKYSKVSKLLSIVQKGKLTKKEIVNGYIPNDTEGNTVFTYAISKGEKRWKEVKGYLLPHADLSKRTLVPNKFSPGDRTPLMVAVYFNLPKRYIEELLTNYSGDKKQYVNEKTTKVTLDPAGMTALMYAALRCNNDNKDLINYLISKGADKSAQNGSGHTAYDIAKDVTKCDDATLLDPSS